MNLIAIGVASFVKYFMLGRVCRKIIKLYISEVKFHDDEWLVDNVT